MEVVADCEPRQATEPEVAARVEIRNPAMAAMVGGFAAVVSARRKDEL